MISSAHRLANLLSPPFVTVFTFLLLMFLTISDFVKNTIMIKELRLTSKYLVYFTGLFFLS